mmetsp:Transcript_14267/g.48785  ORF Transcript_14267/g.48785 Transcript_14267/m.48785 type:complete len:297 (+) Transcript_14267:2126-3016(+)
MGFAGSSSIPANVVRPVDIAPPRSRHVQIHVWYHLVPNQNNASCSCRQGWSQHNSFRIHHSWHQHCSCPVSHRAFSCSNNLNRSRRNRDTEASLIIRSGARQLNPISQDADRRTRNWLPIDGIDHRALQRCWRRGIWTCLSCDTHWSNRSRWTLRTLGSRWSCRWFRTHGSWGSLSTLRSLGSFHSCVARGSSRARRTSGPLFARISLRTDSSRWSLRSNDPSASRHAWGSNNSNWSRNTWITLRTLLTHGPRISFGSLWIHYNVDIHFAFAIKIRHVALHLLFKPLLFLQCLLKF